MTNLELVLSMLAESSTTELSKKKKPETFKENNEIANQGGSVSGRARKDLEQKLGEKVITNLNSNILKEKNDSNKEPNYE